MIVLNSASSWLRKETPTSGPKPAPLAAQPLSVLRYNFRDCSDTYATQPRQRDQHAKGRKGSKMRPELRLTADKPT